ncbi:tyrosine-type recombinase/integrase [Spongiibacter sp. KMU-158]|uniref:Tyrosine-type recombinase/integrase n=1 Tax=Spongiibacter pelagi TaxID=2760804 RepID=A0A927C5V6_9GAMM|nr:site-specific integrase [Spongiibacter pelagi]MBD2859960.1 tyrosine-type recombinase/integrase [Spongiibacter pelagi]
MSLYKRGEVWWVKFTSPSGEQIQRSSGTKDREQALEYHDRLKADLWRKYRLGEKPRRSWQEAVERWLDITEDKADHEKDIGKLRWLDRYLGNKWLDDIDADLIHKIAKAKKSEASPSTANRYLALIRAILRAAWQDWEWIDRVPRVKLYREEKIRVRWITREEAARLIAELPEHLAEMARFTLATGLRQRNCSYLRWDQVDLSRQVAWIHADESKSGKAIAVPLNADAMAVLSERKRKHPVYVFTYKGNPVERTSTKAWAAAKKRAGIEDFRWHDLRHTWASWHVQSGTRLQELQELGGWSSYEMVLRYAHLSGEHMHEAAKRIEGTVLGTVNQRSGLRLVVSH